MEGGRIAKLKKSTTAHGDVSNVDRISNLPTHVLELILLYLPIIDMVRTSILSSNWRNKWTTVPNLVFDKSSSTIVDRVLQLHTGPIKMFKIKGIGAIPDIDRWVLHVCRRSVKELVLKFGSFEQYKLHSYLWQCESLVKLELSKCLLILPPCFEGFKSLKCLCLKSVNLAEDALEHLISSCTLLEELTIINYQHCYYNLKIDARNLRCLDIRGEFHNITFGHVMDRLLEFFFHQFSLINPGISLKINMVEILTNLPSVQSFVVKGDAIQFLSGLPERAPIQCKDLYRLGISLFFGCPDYCFAALYLLRCSPNLTELEIKVTVNKATSSLHWDISKCYWGLASSSLCGDISKCYWGFKKLRLVKMEISNISFEGGYMKLIQFLLATSPVLEKMIFFSKSGSESMEHWNCRDIKQICESKRASANAKIFFDGRLIL